MPDNEHALAVAHEWMAKGDNDLRSAEYLLKMEDCPTVTRYAGDYEPISLSEARQAVRTARRVRRDVRRILEKKPLFQ